MKIVLLFLRLLLLPFAALAVARAFPANPAYTLYGIVRDEVGATLSAEGAELLLLRDGQEIGRTPIYPHVRADRNYELSLRIDAGRASTKPYHASALGMNGVFTLKVLMNGQEFFPLEVSNGLRAGKGGELVHLDLTLGVDSDRDGLPDAWEQWQLYLGGYLPGDVGWDLSLIDLQGDFDHDGVGNYQEYLAGTYAADPTQRFELVLKSLTAEGAAFEFFAMTGKVYTIEQSSDLKTWTVLPFATTPTGTRASYVRATAVGITPAYALPAAGKAQFFRLTVR